MNLLQPPNNRRGKESLIQPVDRLTILASKNNNEFEFLISNCIHSVVVISNIVGTSGS